MDNNNDNPYSKYKDNEVSFEQQLTLLEETNLKPYKPNPLLIPISIIFAGALIAGAIIFNGRAGTTTASTATTANSTVTATQSAVSSNTVTISIKDSYSQGSKNAKVAFVEFGDYQCPYCQSLYQNAIPNLRNDYVNKDKVLYVFENYPLTSIHPVAMIGSEAALCAGEQGKYWQMNDIIYSAQDTSQNDQTKLESYASQIGLDTTKFDSCLKNNTYANTISTETDRGNQIGVQGTPTVVIGTVDYKNMTVTGHIIYGAYPYDTFKQEIDSYLK